MQNTVNQTTQSNTPFERLSTLIDKNGISVDHSHNPDELTLDINVFAFDANESRNNSTLMCTDGTVYLTPDELYDLRHVIVGMMINVRNDYKYGYNPHQKERLFNLSCFIGNDGYGVGHYARVGWYQITLSLHPLECDAQWWAKNVDRVFTEIRQEYIEAIAYINARPQMFVEHALNYRKSKIDDQPQAA